MCSSLRGNPFVGRTLQVIDLVGFDTRIEDVADNYDLGGALQPVFVKDDSMESINPSQITQKSQI